MAGLFALSINQKICKENFLENLFWGIFYHQHLGEEYSGFSIFDGKKIQTYANHGLFRSNFNHNFKNIKGKEGIGYCGQTNEPYFFTSKSKKFSLCFSGNLVNLNELIKKFENSGDVLKRKDDIEIIAKLINSGALIRGFRKLVKTVKGAYSLLVLTEKGIYAFRCPEGRWPLIIGEKQGAVVVASECGCFKNLGFKPIRDVKPGEVVLLKNGCWKIVDKIASKKIKFCSFYWVYTAFANNKFEGIPVALVRKKLGACLARRDIKKGFIPDIVIPVPDSGRFHAIGYHQEFIRQLKKNGIKNLPFYDEILLKYPYAGRSFTPQNQETRNREAQIKLLESGENFRNKIVVVCDDSIVRGTQIKTNLVPKLKMVGVKEIHFRISNPEIRSHCLWGKTTQEGEILASHYPSLEKKIKFLGIDGLEYNTIEDLVEAIGLPKNRLCFDCCLNPQDKC